MPLLSATDLFFFNVLGALAADREPPEIPGEIDWERLAGLVAQRGVGSVFSHYYGKHEAVPEAMRRSWRDVLMSVLLLNERGLKATIKILRMLEEGGIRAAVLRGMALIHGVYPEPYLRAMQDVDLLVESTCGDRIVPCLESHGLSPAKTLRGQFVYRVDETDVEIHWSLLTPKRYRGIADFDAWLDSAEDRTTPHGGIRCLRVNDEFLDLVCHAFVHHELDTVQGLVDIGRLMVTGEIDWEYIRRWCGEAHTGRMFRFVMAFVDYLFELGVDMGSIGFDAALPRSFEAVFDAYTAVLADRDTAGRFLRRKGNLLFVAEQPFTKLKQVIRFFGRRELKSFLSLVRGPAKFAEARRHVGVKKRAYGSGG